jgi:hypothetical protein
LLFYVFIGLSLVYGIFKGDASFLGDTVVFKADFSLGFVLNDLKLGTLF